jgi:hypothetical protein
VEISACLAEYTERRWITLLTTPQRDPFRRLTAVWRSAIAVAHGPAADAAGSANSGRMVLASRYRGWIWLAGVGGGRRRT